MALGRQLNFLEDFSESRRLNVCCPPPLCAVFQEITAAVDEWMKRPEVNRARWVQCAEIHYINVYLIYVCHSVQFLIPPICRLSASRDGWCCPWIWYCFNRQTQRSVTLNCLSDTFNLLYEIFRMAECENRVFIRARPASHSHSRSILVFCTIYAQKVFSI